MAGQSSAMIGWSWTDVSVLGSQVFGQALMDSCGGSLTVKKLTGAEKKVKNISKKKSKIFDQMEQENEW